MVLLQSSMMKCYVSQKTLSTKNKLNNQPQGKKSFNMNFKNHYNTKRTGREKGGGLSMTVPDQTMTVREIINRSEKGLPVSGIRVPLYNETEDGILPDLRNLDLSEVVELKKRMAEAEKQIRKQLQKQEGEQREKDTEEFYRKKFSKPEKVEEAVIITDPKQ